MFDDKDISINDKFPYKNILAGSEKITSDYLVEQFKNMILSEELKSGFPLPNETTLCENLGISRSTLREAFKVLSAYGLITRTTHGTFVNDSKDFSSSLVMDFRFEESSVLEILEFRKIFEAESAYLAAQNATPDDIRELKKTILKMETCDATPAALSLHDFNFHYSIARCTHNKLLISILKLISDTYYKGIRSQFETIAHIGDKTTLEATLYHHNKIFDAILLKDSDEAATRMRRHMDSIYYAVQQRETDGIKNE